MTNVPALKSHVLQLLSKNQISMEWSHSARAYRKTRHVKLPPIKSEITYAVALHEIGHIVGDQPRTRIDREVAAWQWAKTYSLVWTPKMQAAAVRRLESYLVWSRRHQTMKVPGPGHPIYRWVQAA